MIQNYEILGQTHKKSLDNEVQLILKGILKEQLSLLQILLKLFTASIMGESFHCCKDMESLVADFEGHNSAGSKRKMYHVNGPHVIKDST